MVMRQTPFTCGQPGTEVIGDRVPLRPPPLSLHLPSMLHLRGLLPLPTPSHARSQQPLDTRGFLWTSLMFLLCNLVSTMLSFGFRFPVAGLRRVRVPGDPNKGAGCFDREHLAGRYLPLQPSLGFKVPSLLLTPWPPTPVPTTPLLSPSPSNPNRLLSPPS